MAGCLKGGTLTDVAVASKPAKKCASGATKVVWNSKGAKDDKGATRATGATGQPGLAALETITKVIPAGNPADLGGVGNPISLACGTGQMVLSGGVIPSAASLGALDSLLALPLGLLGAGARLDTVTSVLSVVPVSGGDTLGLVAALPANPGDTFYALCATVASAAG